MRLTPGVIGQHVRLKTGRGHTYSEGRVYAYSEAPMLAIETPSGERIWWRADLAEVGDQDNCGDCWACDPTSPYMRVCQACGDKRCRRAMDHHNACESA